MTTTRTLARAATRLAPASALLVGGVLTPASAQPVQPLAAGPQVGFVKVDKECSRYTVDGEAQKQCRVHFTVSATNVEKGYRVSVVTLDPRSPAPTTIGAFVARGTKASMRFTGMGSGEVCSFGSPRSTVHLKFYAVVKDSDGTKLLRTKSQRLC